MKYLIANLIRQGLVKCDIFGYDICLRHQSQRKYKTIFGGIITLMLAVFLIYLFTYFSDDCIKKINPSIRMQNSFANPIVLNASSFIYALQFTDSNKMISLFPFSKIL